MKRFRRFWQLPATVVAVVGLVVGGASIPAAAAPNDENGTSQTSPEAPTTSVGEASDTPADAGEEPSESPAEVSNEAPVEAPDEVPGPEDGPVDPEQNAVRDAKAARSIKFSVEVASDGTEEFDGDDSAGNDSGPSNGVVRVNDIVTYRLNIAANEGLGINTTFTLALPKGMEITSLPAVCLAGSSLNPPSAGEPSLPLSATSVDELQEQTLTCNIGNLENDSKVVDLPVRVLNYVHNGAKLKPTSASLRVDGAPEYTVAEHDLPVVTASARLKWDISINGIALQENTGYFYGPATEPCPWDKARVCKRSGMNLLVSAPTKGKGAMPVIGDFTATADLSFATMYPHLSTEDIQKLNKDKDKYGSRIILKGGYYAVPGPKIGGTNHGVLNTPQNSVRDTGTMTADETKVAEPVEFLISGADMSLRSFPSVALRPEGTAIPGNKAYAVSHFFSVYTPVDTIRDFGVEKDGIRTLDTTYRYTALEMHGYDASDQLILAGQDSFNDYRKATPNIGSKGSLNKAFTGVPGAERNMPPGDFSPGYASRGEGPPGGATLRSGGITVAPTQDVLSQLLVVGSRIDDPADRTVVVCDSWDNTRLHLHSKDVPASTYTVATFQSLPSNGNPVWVSGYNNVLKGAEAGWATSVGETPQLKVQYSAEPGGPNDASQCGDDKGPWFDDPAKVPGNDPAQLAKGVYTGVGRVRVHAVVPAPVANSTTVADGVIMVLGINHKVAESTNVGDIVPNWAAMKSIDGKALDLNAALADATAWSNSGYNPDFHTGSLGDRLIVATAQARVDKQVRKGTAGEFSDVPPEVTGGGVPVGGAAPETPADTVQFRLAPSLTSGALATGVLNEFWVEDCLPTGLDYDSANLSPTIVQKLAKSDGGDEVVLPEGAKIKGCKADETYIRWVYPSQEVNRPMEPIIVSTRVSPLAASGVYRNTVMVWADGDQSSVKQRLDSAEVKISNLAGIKLDKIAVTPKVQINRLGQQYHELNKWQVTLVNTTQDGVGATVENPDIIDVLAKNGVGGSKFNGSFVFESAKVIHGGDKVQILYTKDPNVDLDPNNQGSTVWCDQPTSSTEGCPAAVGEITGLRIKRPGKFDSMEKITVEIALKGEGNAKGDVYVNRAFARADGLKFPVGPIARPEVVVSSSIGDYTWWDVNRNGIQDEVDGAPEKPAVGVQVHLEGADDLGNPVALDSVTNDRGQYRFESLRASGPNGYQITFAGKGKLTTKHASDSNADNDSNADPDSGAADPVMLAANTDDLSVDAGFTATGSLVVTKLLKGQGVEQFAAGDQFDFDVRCTLGGAKVLQKNLTLTAKPGVAEITADPITDIPVGAVCTVTETSGGHSDPGTLPSSSVEIGFDEATNLGNEEHIAITNNYSAGVIRIAKKLTGEPQAIEDAKTRDFVFDVTCKMASDQPPVLHIQGVTVTGESTVEVLGEDGKVAKLPKGAKCWAEETDAAGAIATAIDHHDFDSGVLVDPVNPDELAEIIVTATNTVEVPRVPFRVAKVLHDNGSTGVDEFQVDYRCSAPGRDAGGAEVPAVGSVKVAAGAEALVGNFPVGADCELTGEAPQPRAGYTLDVQFDEKAQVAAPGLVLTVVNSYMRNTGGFEVTKVLGGDDPNGGGGKKFKVDYECHGPEPVEDEAPALVMAGSVEVSADGGAVPVYGIPTGWQCHVTEDQASTVRPHYTLTKSEVAPDSFAVPDPAPDADPAADNLVAVTVTNEYSRDHGVFTVKKQVTGDNAAAFASKVFKVNYTCGDLTGVVEVKGDGVAVSSPPVPTGTTCRLSEDPDSAHEEHYVVASSVTPSEFVVADPGGQTAVVVKNDYKRDKGGLVLTKQVTGSAEDQAPQKFTFEYKCGDSPDAQAQQVVVTPGVATQIPDLPAGKCTVSELDASVDQAQLVTRMRVNDGDFVDTSSVEVDVQSNQTVTVNTVNEYSAKTARFEISKVVKADVDPADIIAHNVFEFTYKCEHRDTVEGTLMVRADGNPVASPELPVGSTCTVVESAASAAHAGFDVHIPEPFVFTLDGSVHKVAAVNNYTRQYGTFSLAKLVKSPVETGTAPYTFFYECTDGTKGDLSVPADGTVAGTGLGSEIKVPVGASCRVWEDVEAAQRPGLILRPAGEMHFSIVSKGQHVALTAVNTYVPEFGTTIPLIPIVPLNPVVPGQPSSPVTRVINTIVAKGRQLASTGVSGMMLPLAGFALVLIAGGVFLVRRKKD